MNKIESDVKFTLYPDYDYQYVVESHDGSLKLSYTETVNPECNTTIVFASTSEAEEVAKKILLAVSVMKELQ
jgi:hypothetical protein